MIVRPGIFDKSAKVNSVEKTWRWSFHLPPNWPHGSRFIGSYRTISGHLLPNWSAFVVTIPFPFEETGNNMHGAFWLQGLKQSGLILYVFNHFIISSFMSLRLKLHCLFLPSVISSCVKNIDQARYSFLYKSHLIKPRKYQFCHRFCKLVIFLSEAIIVFTSFLWKQH